MKIKLPRFADIQPATFYRTSCMLSVVLNMYVTIKPRIFQMPHNKQILNFTKKYENLMHFMIVVYLFQQMLYTLFMFYLKI